MGKKGELLRQQKLKTSTYTFTAMQLEEHDKAVRRAYKDRVIAEARAEFDQKAKAHDAEVRSWVEKEWAERERIFGGSHRDNMFTILGLLLACSSRVLIERFRWKPVPQNGGDRRYRTVRFAQALIDEINGIASDEKKDIRKYIEDTYDLYGIRYTQEEEKDG